MLFAPTRASATFCVGWDCPSRGVRKSCISRHLQQTPRLQQHSFNPIFRTLQWHEKGRHKGAGRLCRLQGPSRGVSCIPMKRIISVSLMIFVVINLCLAEETAFRGVKLADAKGKQADASLIFSDNNKNVAVR